jgi:pimeloyl-ACP methyl ester carboxylesterase
MSYPIIEIKTADGINLYGLLSGPARSDVIYLNIHGTGSNFYCEKFQEIFYDQLPPMGVDTLFTNNRGSYAMDSWQDTGAALEIFEDSLLDIDAWIEWAIKENYSKIILSGHSHGTEKVAYYMNNGKHKDKISAIVLMGFCDSFGTQKNYEKTISENLMAEALQKVNNNKGYELLTGQRRAQAGEVPISAKTYLNYFSKDSELSKVLPFRGNATLPMIRKIDVPILCVIGDHDEYTVIPIEEAACLIEKENKLAKVYQIDGSGHSYEGYQQELIILIKDFLSRILKKTDKG